MSGKGTFLIVVLLIAMSAFHAAAESVPVASTDDWAPPDLSGLTAASSPGLLVLKVAQEEIGYMEGPLSDETKYGAWFGDARCAWCAEFLTWCVNEADARYGTSLLREVYPFYGGSKEGAPFFIKKGRFISDNGRLPTREKQWLVGSCDYLQNDGYIPAPGDYLWLFYHSRNRGPDHVALVEGVSRDSDGKILIHVIEGNNPDRVQRNRYPIDDKLIYGYGTPVKRANAVIRLYCTGDDVRRLKGDLVRLGYLEPGYSASRDVVDHTVLAAVVRFQKDKGLAVTRGVDIGTRAALDAALAAMN